MGTVPRPTPRQRGDDPDRLLRLCELVSVSGTSSACRGGIRFSSRSDPRRRALDANGGSYFGLQYLPTTLWHSLRPDALGRAPMFPWVTFPRFRTTVFGTAVIDMLDVSSSVPAPAGTTRVVGSWDGLYWSDGSQWHLVEPARRRRVRAASGTPPGRRAVASLGVVGFGDPVPSSSARHRVRGRRADQLAQGPNRRSRRVPRRSRSHEPERCSTGSPEAHSPRTFAAAPTPQLRASRAAESSPSRPRCTTTRTSGAPPGTRCSVSKTSRPTRGWSKMRRWFSRPAIRIIRPCGRRQLP